MPYVIFVSSSTFVMKLFPSIMSTTLRMLCCFRKSKLLSSCFSPIFKNLLYCCLLHLLYNVMKKHKFSVYFIFYKSYNIFTKALVVKTTSLKQLSLYVLFGL